jgi:hypothetical protein
VHPPRIKVSILSLGGWMRKKLSSSSEEEGDDKEKYENGKALVEFFHPGY